MANPTTAAGPAKAPTSFADQPVALKVFILAFAISFVSVLYYFVFHMQLAEDIESAESRHRTLLTERVEADRRRQEFVRLSQELVDREPIDRRNRRILPESQEIPSFLGDMNRLAELSGLAIQRVQPEPETPEAAYTRIPVSMRFRGRYHQFAKFFHSVSQLERAVNLENIDVRIVAQTSTSTSPPEEGAVPEIPLDVSLLATTFRRPPIEAPAAGGAAPAPGATP